MTALNIGDVTIFRSIKDISTPYYKDIDAIIERIKKGSSKDVVKRIRQEKDKKKRDEIKATLPAICFSGAFSKRNDDSLIEHSGLICLDFDGYEKHKDMLEDKEAFSKDKFVFSVFISPSGNGLKVLVRIPPVAEDHLSYFNGLEQHFNNPRFDKTTKNLSRVCYESYDPSIFVNKNASVWETRDERQYTEYVKFRDAPTIPMKDENKIVDNLVKWWRNKYPMIEGQRNQNAYILAMALNEFGVSQSMCQYVLHQYADGSFSKKEIDRTIESAYQNTSTHGTKYYEDEEKVNNIRAKIKKGATREEISYHLEESGYDRKTIESVVDRIEHENNNVIFWSKSDRGVVKIIHILFKQFLEDNGFFKYCPSESKDFVFVKVKNNLIDHTTEKEIKDFVLNYLLELNDIAVYNYFADNTRFFKEEFLSMIKTIDAFFISDTKETSYLYYLNCAVKVTQDNIEAIDYLDLGALVWRQHVIPREYTICSFSKTFDYVRFIANICANDEARIQTMETTIGFLMHGFKNMSYCPAVILNDEVISENPMGGTGKGIFMTALGHIKKLVQIDGKTFSFDKTFPYQRVSADTQILCFDDVGNFDFERLFSVITEGITTEKKNKDEIRIPFEKSPKIAITTNYAIKGAGNSFERRKWEVELHQYYSMNFTPYDEFGRFMFGEWDDGDWCEFDNYMIYCLQLYMYKGLVKSKFVNLNIRQLSAATSHEFIEWVGLLDKSTDSSPLPLEFRLYKQDLYNEFINEYPDYSPKSKLTISRNKFYKWLNDYAVYISNQEPEEGRDARGRWLIIHKKKDVES